MIWRTIGTWVRYPKLLGLLLSVLVASIIFTELQLAGWHETIVSLGYVGVFVAGMLYSYGFTAAPATAILLAIAGEFHPVTAGIVAGLGAVISDLIIFQFVRHSFLDEIGRIKQWRIMQVLGRWLAGPRHRYWIPILGFIAIASPLPDEIGVSLVASSWVSRKSFIILAYLLNTAGIIIILAIGKYSV